MLAVVPSAWPSQEGMCRTDSRLGKPSEPQRALSLGLLRGGDAACRAQTRLWC